MTQLVGGSALQVEDLDVTMRVVTFTVPTLTTSQKLQRFLRNLETRDIGFSFEHVPESNTKLALWNTRAKVKVGARVLIFCY